MYRTVASKDGGYNVELSPEEAKKIQDDWAAYALKRQKEEAKEALEHALMEDGLNKLMSSLPPEEAALLKKKLMQ